MNSEKTTTNHNPVIQCHCLQFVLFFDLYRLYSVVYFIVMSCFICKALAVALGRFYLTVKFDISAAIMCETGVQWIFQKCSKHHRWTATSILTTTAAPRLENEVNTSFPCVSGPGPLFTTQFNTWFSHFAFVLRRSHTIIIIPYCETAVMLPKLFNKWPSQSFSWKLHIGNDKHSEPLGQNKQCRIFKCLWRPLVALPLNSVLKMQVPHGISAPLRNTNPNLILD